MIIDVHGHYTTAPPALEAWRKRKDLLAEAARADQHEPLDALGVLVTELHGDATAE